MVMAAGEMEHGLELVGFSGENPTGAEHLLPGNVSPDALNIDYRDGTLRKRAGVGRLSRHNMLGGGVWVRRTSADWGRAVQTASGFSLSGTTFIYECIVHPFFSAVGAEYVIWRHVTAGAEGLFLSLVDDGGVYKYRVTAKTSAGANGVTVAAASTSTPAKITVTVDTTIDQVFLNVNGTTGVWNYGVATYTAPTGVMKFGGESGSDDGVSAIISDFRIWEGTAAGTLQTDLRALNAAEQTAALVAWWRFLQDDPLADSSGNGRVLSAASSPLFVDGYTASAEYARVDAITGAKFAPAWYSVLAGSRTTVYEGQMRANVVMNVETRLGNYGPVSGRGPFRMQLLPYREYVVAMNGYGENSLALWGGSGDVGWLSIPAPTASTQPSATAAGSGGSLSAGDYRYQYSLYNSVTGVESAVGLFESTETAVSNDEITLDLTTGGFVPDKYLLGVDKIRIYRTTAGGSTFYYLTQVDIDATSHADGLSDTTLQAQGVLPTFTGYASPSRFGFEMEDRLWLGNQAGNESRLVYTERFGLGSFYSENFLDVGFGDGDVLTGGYGVADRAVVFKRRSTWLVSAAGPSVYKLAAGVGCVQQATIAAAHNALFWMGEGGVYTMPLPLGAGSPVSLTGAQWRSFFAEFTDADYEDCCGVWDAFNERYLLSVMMGGVRKVLVFTAGNPAWALWDVDVSAFVVLGGGGTNKLYCGWRGWLAELETGLNDGGNPHTTAHAASGTVTAGGDYTLTDSAATWTAVSDVVNGRLAGLNNLSVRVADADGGNVQVRTIVDNTATVLTVSEAWDTNPAAGWTYMLGAIEGRWRSPKLGLERWDRRETVRRCRVLNVTPAAASGDESTVFLSVDGDDDEEYVNGADDRVKEHLVRAGHGREVVVGVRQTSAEETFEVGSLALPFLPAEGI